MITEISLIERGPHAVTTPLRVINKQSLSIDLERKRGTRGLDRTYESCVFVHVTYANAKMWLETHLSSVHLCVHTHVARSADVT